jgi:hypothetical protein
MPVPIPSLCLVSLIISLALQADVFSQNSGSVEERRPDLEHVHYVPLKWRSSR